MSTRFAQIFWGLFLVVTDIRIGRFDILPDFIGYILIAIGCAGLVGVSRQFSTASTLSWVLAGVSVLGYFLRGRIFTASGLVILAVDCAMMWTLLGGIMELATARQRMDLAERASNRRMAYVIIMCLITLVAMATAGTRHSGTVMVMTLILLTIPLLILILHLIHTAKNELVDGPP